jgi:hypothetical protein
VICKKKLISEKYSQEEMNNLNEIEQVLNKSSQYVRIEPGESKILCFVLGRKIEEVEKPYNGQLFKRISFTVVDKENNENSEKVFEVGKKSARLIIAKLKEGHTVLKIERIGTGQDTLYVPTRFTPRLIFRTIHIFFGDMHIIRIVEYIV